MSQSQSRAMRPSDDILGLIGEAVENKREEVARAYWVDLRRQNPRNIPPPCPERPPGSPAALYEAKWPLSRASSVVRNFLMYQPPRDMIARRTLQSCNAHAMWHLAANGKCWCCERTRLHPHLPPYRAPPPPPH